MRKKKKLATRDKTFAQREHFKKRAFERFGFEINRFIYGDMIDMIQNDHWAITFVEKQSNRVSVYEIYLWNDRFQLDKMSIYVYYDKERKTLATCMTKEMANETIN
tara:strand:- start:8520 stop:8837 length:318 start_codon:yes stop_codon:yes gene_type:complete